MAKRARQRKGGRVTPKGTHPQAYRAPLSLDPPGRDADEPNLMRQVQTAVDSDHPLELLALASSMLSIVDPRRPGFFEKRAAGDRPGLTREEFIRSFSEAVRPETSALLAAVAGLSADETERRHIALVLGGRRHRLPDWLDGMDRAHGYRAVEMTHVLRDGDTVMVGVALPSGHELTATVYIDHNLGTVVKDGLVVAEPIDVLVHLSRSTFDGADVRWTDLALGDARVRIADAIAKAAITFPPLETSTWPASRPLVEWMVALLPGGGTGYERPGWPDAARSDLRARFLASPYATGRKDPDHADLVDAVLGFGCDYGPGDPLRWSPAAVEIFLDDWIPRKIVADPAYLAKAPALLRGFVQFCHAERGIRPSLTAETLDAIDHCESDYQATIASSRPQGPAALLAAVGVSVPGGWDDDGWDDDGWDDDGWDDDESDDDEPDGGYGPGEYGELVLDGLRRAVGGAAALATLDGAPLPDEAFDWTGIPGDIAGRVADVLALCDRCGEELLDLEFRTATRRVLARIARSGPDVFRRRGRSDTAAAALCWAVGRANELFGPGGMHGKDLLGHFGLSQSSVASRAATLLKAGGFPSASFDLALGSADYLVSFHRRRLVVRRDLHAG